MGQYFKINKMAGNKKLFNFFQVDELGKEWLMNKFVELCIISIILIFYRCKSIFDLILIF